MPIEWYSPITKPHSDVKISASSILLTDSGVAKLSEIDSNFADATAVKLGWDSSTSTIVIAPAAFGDSASFKYSKRGRSATTRAISASKFFSRFGIKPTTAGESIGLVSTDGHASFQIPAAPATDAPKRRGRRPKNAVA